MYTYIKSQYWKPWAICLIVMACIGYIMKEFRCFSVSNLIAIEFANTPTDLQAMVERYRNLDCNALYNNTVLDFSFMIAYTLVFYFSGRIIVDLLEFTANKWLVILLLPFVLDVAENLFLLQIITNGTTDFSFTGFYYAVRLKWLLVIPAALLSIMVALYQLYVGIDKVYCWWIKYNES